MSMAYKQHGMSILELMIAVTIGLFISAGIVQIFIANKQTTRFQEEMARLQENGRFAIDIIARDLRSADYWGCAGDKSRVVNHVKSTSANFFDINKAIAGEDGGDDPDTLVLIGAKSIDENKLKVNSVFQANEAIPVTINGLDPASLVGQALVVADCEHSDIIEVSAVEGGLIKHELDDNEALKTCETNKHCLSDNYAGRTFLFQPFIAEYELEEDTLIRTVNGTKMTVASGVSDLQVHYGLDLDGSGSANRYVNESNVADFNQVVSVKVHLLVSTPDDNVAREAQSVKFNWLEKMIAAGITDVNDEQLDTKGSDRRIRHPFTVTVAVRNRIP